MPVWSADPPFTAWTVGTLSAGQATFAEEWRVLTIEYGSVLTVRATVTAPSDPTGGAVQYSLVPAGQAASGWVDAAWDGAASSPTVMFALDTTDFVPGPYVLRVMPTDGVDTPVLRAGLITIT